MIAFIPHVFDVGIFLSAITSPEVKYMPNPKILSEKQKLVEELAVRISEAEAGVFVDYKGITVLEDAALRRDLSEEQVEYSVIKNTLARFAIDKVGPKELLDVLSGTTSLATSRENPIAPLRILSKHSKKLGDRFNIKAAYMDGRVLSPAEIESLSKFESKEAVYSVVLGTMLAPITSLAVVLGQILQQSGGSLEAAEAQAAE